MTINFTEREKLKERIAAINKREADLFTQIDFLEIEKQAITEEIFVLKRV